MKGSIQLCLLAKIVIDVLGKGDVPLENSQIRDQIEVNDRDYKTMYRFGHCNTHHSVCAYYISLSRKGTKRKFVANGVVASSYVFFKRTKMFLILLLLKLLSQCSGWHTFPTYKQR